MQSGILFRLLPVFLFVLSAIFTPTTKQAGYLLGDQTKTQYVAPPNSTSGQKHSRPAEYTLRGIAPITYRGSISHTEDLERLGLGSTSDLWGPFSFMADVTGK